MLPGERTRPYDARDLLARLLDGSDFDEFKATYGQTLVCGTGWIEGWPVGIVAHQRSIVPRKTGTGDAFVDAWFVGYAPDLVMGVWMGNDVPRSMPGLFGGTGPVRAFNRVLRDLIRQKENKR